MRIPALIQEQNSFPGITNRILAGKVQKICVAYTGMDRFFPQEKLVLTGNPIRQDLTGLNEKRKEAIIHFGLSENKTTILVIGGSLGAATINQSILNCLRTGNPSGNIQWIWQCGKFYFEKLCSEMKDEIIVKGSCVKENNHLYPFIDRMDLAYSAADVVISRAGAIAISELCAVGKPVILVPSPNVAEDHQTKNALALVEKKAAMMIRDNEAVEALGSALGGLLTNTVLQEEMKKNILSLAVTDAASRIASEALKLIKNKENLIFKR